MSILSDRNKVPFMFANEKPKVKTRKMRKPILEY